MDFLCKKENDFVTNGLLMRKVTERKERMNSREN